MTVNIFKDKRLTVLNAFTKMTGTYLGVSYFTIKRGPLRPQCGRVALKCLVIGTEFNCSCKITLMLGQWVGQTTGK